MTFKLNERVADAEPGSVTLSSGERIATETFIWTAGVTASPILQQLPVPHNDRGAVLVDPTLALPDYSHVWALGDGASVPDTNSGKICPPTAQAATRQAVCLAKNIRANLRGRRLRKFRFDPLAACAWWVTRQRAPRSSVSNSAVYLPGFSGAEFISANYLAWNARCESLPTGHSNSFSLGILCKPSILTGLVRVKVSQS